MNERTEEDVDYLFLASTDSSSSSEDEGESGDIFSVSCHSSHFKRMKAEPEQCNEFAIKRRKFNTQLKLLDSDLMLMTVGVSKPRSAVEESSLRPVRRPRQCRGVRKCRKTLMQDKHPSMDRKINSWHFASATVDCYIMIENDWAKLFTQIFTWQEGIANFFDSLQLASFVCHKKSLFF